MTAPRPGIAVTVLAGVDRRTTSLLAAGLLTRTDDCATIWVDPTTADAGYVLRVVDTSDGWHETRRIGMGDCLSCTLLGAVTEALTRLRDHGRCRTAVVELHPAVELDAATERLCADLSPDVARVDTVLAVLDPARWLADLESDEDLVARGIAVDPDDRRPVSTLIAAQLDVADHLVFSGGNGPVRGGPATATALHALAPTARRMTPPTPLDVPPGFALATGAHDPRCLHPLSDRGLLDWASPAPAGGGLGVMRWWRRGRPFHLGRFTAVLDDLGPDLVRGAGRVWFAQTPGTAVRWDSCGASFELAAVGHTAPRGQRLALLGRDLDHDALADAFTASLLTDEELAAGTA